MTMLLEAEPDAAQVAWRPTRQSAVERLETFIPRAGRAYAATRNFDRGPHERSNVSALSPYIRHRLILEEEVLRATLRQHRFSAAQKFVQEVFWRTYFKGWLEQRPQVWTRYRASIEELSRRLQDDPSLGDRYLEAVEGRTGIDCFDAWARELVETGYLHNHSRMWFASIWIFTLRLPWQLGADFFYRHLLDGDPASNTLGWRWVAGLHTKGKTYLARAPNIARYTDGRFNPEGQLADKAPALTEPEIGPVAPLPCGEPCPSTGRFGLLVTEEDCGSELLGLPQQPVAAIGVTATEARSPLPVGSLARNFATGAVADALDRAGRSFRVETIQSEGADWASVLVDWARRQDLDTIVTAYAPVGPVAERLSQVEGELGKADMRLLRVLRPYDAAAWPHAGKGFFGLKAKIPMLLSALDITA